MSEVKFKVSDITKKLGIKIANLEIQLANEQVAKESYQKKVKELEQEKIELKTDYETQLANEQSAKEAYQEEIKQLELEIVELKNDYEISQ